MSPVNDTTLLSLGTIPTELRLKIFDLAMSTDEEIDVTAPSDSHVKEKPNPLLGVGLLRTCHQYYHEARPFLYAGKKLLFARNGADLLAWKVVMGLPRCVALGCEAATYRPMLNRATLSIGHRSCEQRSDDSMFDWYLTLQKLRDQGGIEIHHLRIVFEHGVFRMLYQLTMIADALRAVKGVDDVEIVGGKLTKRGVDMFCVAVFGRGPYVRFRDDWYEDMHCGYAIEEPRERRFVTPPNTPSHEPEAIVGPLSNAINADRLSAALNICRLFL